MGKGKKPGDNAASEHVSRPLASLKDPSSFGPPPKNVNYHGGAALPNEITPHRGGIGAPLTPEQIASANRAVQGSAAEPAAEPEVRSGPPLPYRANTTGLSTDHLPPPPVHRGILPPPNVSAAEPPKLKPGLPPRLPARQNTSESMTPPPPSYEAVTASPPQPASSVPSLNQSAVNRLGKAGVSVPNLGINRTTSGTSNADNPWANEQSSSQSPARGNGLSELQSRFSRMNSTESANQAHSPSAQAASPPSLQQTQSAVTTAQNFHRDPSSVSVNDAKNAASTANSAARSASAFRDKHAGSIAAAEQRGRSFNNKYQLQSRFERFLDKHAPLDGEEEEKQQQIQAQSPAPQQPPQHWQQQPPATSPPVQSPRPEMTASISRKPPPPPPPKKPAGMHGNTVAAPPPPVPLGTKPSYS